MIFFPLQCYLFVYCTGWRDIKSFLTFGLICLCNMYLHELRNLWQIFFHLTVGAFSTLQIWLRQPQGKSPDYNVWWLSSDLLKTNLSQAIFLLGMTCFSAREILPILWDMDLTSKFFLKGELRQSLGTNWGTKEAPHCAGECTPITNKMSGRQCEKLHIQNYEKGKDLYWTWSAYQVISPIPN